MNYLFVLHKAAMHSGDTILMKQALDEMKELADKTGLEMMKNESEMMRKAGQAHLQMMKRDVDVLWSSIKIAVIIFIGFYFFGFGYGILFLWLCLQLW